MTRWFDPALQNIVIGDANTTLDGSESTLISQGGSVREISIATLFANTALTGVPTAPTAAVDTNTTQIATTAFVIGEAGSANPLADGVAAAGVSLRYSRQDHVHPNTGTLTAGASSVLNPVALNTKTAQAHGLGTTPAFYHTYIECLSAELGYSVGDRVGNADLNGATGWMVEFDATNITTITSNTNIAVINKTTPAGTVAITLAKWKVVAVPYKLN